MAIFAFCVVRLVIFVVIFYGDILVLCGDICVLCADASVCFVW